MILSFVTFSLNVYAVDEGYFRYEEYNDGVVITSASARKIEQIPEYLGGKKVVRLGWRAFYTCWNDKSKIIIPEYVTEIEAECFLGLGKGGNIDLYFIPAGIKYIGDRALGYYSPHYITNPDHRYEITRNPLVFIVGYKNTVAETYAKENNFEFIPLDEEPEIPTTEPTEETTEPVQPTETTETTLAEATEVTTETTLTEATEVTTDTTLMETTSATEVTDTTVVTDTTSSTVSETTIPVTSTAVESETIDTVSTYITTATMVSTTTSTATLPETGYSKWYHDLIAAAVGMVGVGSAAIIKSGFFRKKEDYR